MSRFEKIVRFISDIDVKTTLLQNAVFLVAILFITFATGYYKLKLNISIFLAIMAVLFVVLAVLRRFYKINTEFTILGQSLYLFAFLWFAYYRFCDYKVYNSVRKGLVYGKILPDSLIYYHQQNELDSTIGFNNHIFVINFFAVFDDQLKTRDIVCLIKQIDKKTKCAEIMLASFEETLAILSEVSIKNTMLYDIWLKKAELLAEKGNYKFYKKIIDKIKVFKKRVEKIAEKNRK